MKIFPAIPVVIFLSLVSCGKKNESANKAEPDPRALVETVSLKKSAIDETIISYANIIAQADHLDSLSVPYESHVLRVLVASGQTVEKNQPILDIEPSPDAKLQLAQARSAAKTSASLLAETKKRYELKLAVNQDLDQARQTARDAAARLASLEKRGLGQNQTLRAPSAGIVDNIVARAGAIIAAGAPLADIVPAAQIEVRLGIEPEDLAKLSTGQKVQLISVGHVSPPETGKIRLLTRRVNPQTRLIDVFVTLPQTSKFLLDGYIRSEIHSGTHEGLLVPRNAVLFRENGKIVFTIKDGKAIRHDVETADKIEISSDSLKADDKIVTAGNAQLEEGMSVRQSKK